MLPAATVMHKDESTGANVAPTNQSDNGWRAQLSWQFPNCDGKPANMQLFDLLVGRERRRRCSFAWRYVRNQILTEQEEDMKMPPKRRDRDSDYCVVTQVKHSTPSPELCDSTFTFTLHGGGVNRISAYPTVFLTVSLTSLSILRTSTTKRSQAALKYP